MPALKVLNRKI